MSKQYDRALSKAKRLAQQQNKTWAVISIDHGDTRLITAVPYTYLNDTEFDAFDGALIVVCYPDGTLE